MFALALYSLRLLGYSFIESASQSLFLEVHDFIFLSLYLLFLIQVLKPFGNSLLVIAAMTYAKNNASIETMASLEVKIDPLQAPATNPVCLCVPKLFNGVYMSPELSPVFKGPFYKL